MRFLGRSFGSLLAAVILIGAATIPAGWAQESFDPSALDAKGSPQTAKSKSKKAAQSKETPAAKPTKPGGDRQFGELEGWSPGKTPGSKETPQETSTSSGASSGKAPVSLSPSGNMSVGLPF
jgi:hypothetical protein